MQKLKQGPNFPESEERIVGEKGGRKKRERIFLLNTHYLSPHTLSHTLSPPLLSPGPNRSLTLPDSMSSILVHTLAKSFY